MLVNFLKQFYQLYQGQHQALDLEMEKLLAYLSQSSNCSHDLIGNISQLEQHQQQLIAQLVEKKNLLDDSIAELKQLSILPEQVNQHIKESSFNSDKKVDKITISALLSEMSEVIKLYRFVVFEINKESQLDHNDSDHIIGEYVENLIAITQNLHINVALRDELDELFDHVKNTKTPHELYNNFQQLICLLVKNINNEKQASSYFIEMLNKALLDVKTVVNDSSSRAEKSSEKRQEWDRTIVTHVEKIGSQLESTDNIEQNHAIISSEIKDILKAIQYKEMFDRQEYKVQSQNFKDMEEKLKAVEQEALGYKSKLDEQRVLSMQDSLTKLPNRAALDERFSFEFLRAQQLKTPLWVAVADLDFFKRINDSYGHTAGDKTLQAVASLISRSLRDSEFIARFGGEEFVILIPDINKIVVEKMLNRVREKVKSIPFKFKGKKITVTISIGATRVKESDSGEYFAFERADQALYQAKEQGRDCVIIS